jgi:esterase/lipase superfamily enzyme
VKMIWSWFLMTFILALNACSEAPSKPAPSSINYPPSEMTGSAAASAVGLAVPEVTPGSAIVPIAAANKNYAIVQVYYAVDRKGYGSSPTSKFYGSDSSDVSFGKCMVSIPNDHQLGELESTSIFKLEFHEEPNKQIVILNVTKKDEKSYYMEIEKGVRHSKHKNALIYINGFNLTIEDAAKRTAQLAYDLNFDGVPVSYSWPSQANNGANIAEENTINWTQSHLETFLIDFASKTTSKNIYIIANDMGSRALIQTLNSLAIKNQKYKSRFKIIIFQAAEIDADIFKNQIAPAFKIIAGQQLTTKAHRK